MPLIENLFDGSTAAAGRVFSLAIVSFTVAVLIIPRLAQFSQSLFFTGLMGIVGAGFLLLASFAKQYWLFVLCFSAGFGFASGALYINVLSMAAASAQARWLTPVMVALFGLGGVVFGPLWRQLVANDWGTQSLLPLAGLLLLGAIGASYIDRGLMSATFNWKSNRPAYHAHAARQPLIGSFRLLLIWGIFASGSMAGLMVLGLASKIIEHAGGSVIVASAGIAGIAFGNTVGRLSVSLQLLVIRSTSVAFFAIVVVIAGLLIVMKSPNAQTIAFGLVLVAFGYGIIASAIPVIVQQEFGAANFSSHFSVIFTAWGLAGLTSPWLAGVLFDAAGSFSPAIQLALLATIFCSILLIWFVLTDRKADH